MLRSPRLWLYVAGGWLFVAGLGHLTYHTWGLILENDVSGGLREFAMQAMKQAQSPDPLRPSLWRVFRLYSSSLALLFLFAGIVDLAAAFGDVPHRVQRGIALLQTVFWTVAFIPFAFVDPVIQPLIVVGLAVPLHGIAYITAEVAEREDDSERAVPSGQWP
ncbi:MAG: hypothetical protein KJO65_02920 [Gemmatimonadetes bacterium]|nr:hypothetical protein [Gemmatimonadota bacterium]